MDVLIKKVDDDVHKQLKLRAIMRGINLRDYLAEILTDKANENPVLDSGKKVTALKK